MNQMISGGTFWKLSNVQSSPKVVRKLSFKDVTLIHGLLGTAKHYANFLTLPTFTDEQQKNVQKGGDPSEWVFICTMELSQFIQKGLGKHLGSSTCATIPWWGGTERNSCTMQVQLGQDRWFGVGWTPCLVFQNSFKIYPIKSWACWSYETIVLSIYDIYIYIYYTIILDCTPWFENIEQHQVIAALMSSFETTWHVLTCGESGPVRHPIRKSVCDLQERSGFWWHSLYRGVFNGKALKSPVRLRWCH